MNEHVTSFEAAKAEAPFIKAETYLPEITFKSVILAIIITAVLEALMLI